MTTAVRTDYLAVHIFYNVQDLRAVVLGCVDPLVQRLTRSGLISRFFFVRYWEGGNHVRLRVLPTTPDQKDAVREEIDREIPVFLREQPSMLDPDVEDMREVIRSLYEFEHGVEAFQREFANTEIPIYPNNSYRHMPYVPEYGRYGGLIGIDLAQRNFMMSSEIAIRALRDNNVRMHANVLGLAFQMTLNFAFAFFSTRDETARFFEHFVNFFDQLETPVQITDRLDQFFNRQSDRVLAYVNQLEAIHARLKDSDGHHFGRYVRHAYDMREVIMKAYEEDKLEFTHPPTSASDVLFRLVTSYTHMTNNRLGLLIFEEVYIAGLIAKALRS
jgi:thiopeptide-type bacteriocin biosynthesis protein